MFFTTFLKILDGWQNDSQAISRRVLSTLTRRNGHASELRQETEWIEGVNRDEVASHRTQT